MNRQSRPIHLIGSVPLNSAEDVFVTVARELQDRIRRIPDGETGERLAWIVWQQRRMAETPALEVGGERQILDGKYKNPQYRLKPGFGPEDVEFPDLGYAAVAKASYATFKRLKEDGRIPQDVRFQVSLPTPLAVAFGYFVPAQMRQLWPAYEKKLLQEIGQILAHVPHHELAIQWDVAVEIDGILEVPEVAKDYSIEELVDGIARVAEHVPEAVELGLHFCYGDPDHKHLVEPKDMALMVDLFNRIARQVSRPIHWLHMPVPRDRDDDAYFSPLANLELPAGTQLFLGLVHLTDGVDGLRRRLRAASKYVEGFGVATECGLGRRAAATMPALFYLHRQAADLAIA
jgi:hypothetical protein